MWRYLEHINTLLNGIVRVTSDLPKAQIATMKLYSSSQLRRTNRNTESEKMITSHSNVPYVTNANGELIPGVLIYIMEGALPMIKV